MNNAVSTTGLSTKAVKVLFWVACIVIFSKIVWYDLSAYYLDSGERREFLTFWFAAWIIAQFLVFLVAIPWLIREITAPTVFWALAVAPYFILGLVYGRFGIYYLGDVARYALPVGWMLLFSLAARRLSGTEILRALIVTLASCVAIRLCLHLMNDTGRLRYGRHYELFLVGLLLVLPIAVKFQRLVPVTLLTLAVAISMLFGNTRVMLLGLCGMSVLAIGAVFIDRRYTSPQRWTTVLTGCLVTTLAGLTLTGNMPGVSNRVNIESVLRAPINIAVPSPPPGGDAKTPSKSAAEASSDDKTANAVPPTSDVETKNGIDASRSDELERARENWANTLRNANLGFGERIAEGTYFIEAMRQSSSSFWLGSGAGDSVSININKDDVRVVRGAHNTFVTLLYRHGAIFGTLLILFVCLYGLPMNLRQLMQTHSASWRVILTALISYRLVIIALAQLHQGLFDDPVIFLSIAVATGGLAPLSRSPLAQEPQPVSRWLGGS